jgi:predicted SprT family Zn-dependent metalloprotease
MILSEAKELASLYIQQYAPDYTFRFGKGVYQFGSCNYTKRTISLSSRLTEVNDFNRVEKTIIHEIAHAIVGPGHGHNSTWEKKCLELGGNGRQHWTEQDTVSAQTKYTLTCPKCGGSHGRERNTKRTRTSACSRCCRKYNGGRHSSEYVFKVVQNH